jgi:hypothetical protein
MDEITDVYSLSFIPQREQHFMAMKEFDTLSSTFLSQYRPSVRMTMNISTASNVSSNLDRVLNILDSADEVVSDKVSTNEIHDTRKRKLDDHDDVLLEPTPLGPQGVRVGLVQEFPLAGNANTEEIQEELLNLLSPLLPHFMPPSATKRRRSSKEVPGDISTLSSSPSPVAVASAGSPRGSLLNQEQGPALICDPTDDEQRFRPYQSDQWKDRFEDLVDFRNKNGNCLVPHNFPENQQLAQWIKRQRYQYKLKHQVNLHSTLTDERQTALENMGFVWDSHKAAWIERFQSLKQFRAQYGHCSVPSSYMDRSLAIWVKCQRRQFKMFQQGARSTMTQGRFSRLDLLGFVWNPRNL